MPVHNRLGLSLSGGGYRAAFHLGTLKKISELDILEKVDVLSAISGGSITVAYFSLGSKIENAIPDFVQNMIDGHILKEVTNAHEFDQTRKTEYLIRHPENLAELQIKLYYQN
ncbi:MAG: hypothetical protein JWO92_728 [Chitinophagaceae bacterium]|nr:hypothetical protein [Chitinophagaceae bacterium]